MDIHPYRMQTPLASLIFVVYGIFVAFKTDDVCISDGFGGRPNGFARYQILAARVPQKQGPSGISRAVVQ